MATISQSLQSQKHATPRRLSRILGDATSYIVLLVLMVIMLYPVFWMFL